MKRIQNQVAESRYALPIITVYGILVWIAGGLIQQQWWMQFICFLVATYLMVELNNSNALIRVYSRTVSCAFIILSCMTCFLFASMKGAIVQLCVVAFLITAFHCYQDRESTGWTFYAFLCIGLASLAEVHILYFLPVCWGVMAFSLYSVSWRTFLASVIGILTPYWFAGAYFLWQSDMWTPVSHFMQLTDIRIPYDYAQIGIAETVSFAWLVILTVTGIIHYIRQSSNDSIRIRMFYNCFITIDLYAITLLALMPQYFDPFIRVIAVNTAPLIAHFLSLTKTKITNIAFCVIVVVSLLITACNLWLPLLIS